MSDAPQDPTLDKFFAQHNSEDNASFKELVKTSQERLRKSKPWLFKNQNPPADPQLLLLHSQTATQTQPPLAAIAAPSTAVSSPQPQVPPTDPANSQPEGSAMTVQHSSSSPSQVVVHDADMFTATRDADRAVQRPGVQTDGYGTTGQDSQTLISWPHTNKSALYYDSSQRDAVPFTEAELADMVQGPPKQIKHSATRFAPDFETSQQSSKVTTLHLVRSKSTCRSICFMPLLPLHAIISRGTSMQLPWAKQQRVTWCMFASSPAAGIG